MLNVSWFSQMVLYIMCQIRINTINNKIENICVTDVVKVNVNNKSTSFIYCEAQADH